MVAAALTCPTCGNPHRVGLRRVLTSGPLGPSECAVCGGKFHPSLARSFLVHQVAWFPFVIGAGLVPSSIVGFSIAALGAAISALFVIAVVPMVEATSSAPKT